MKPGIVELMVSLAAHDHGVLELHDGIPHLMSSLNLRKTAGGEPGEIYRVWIEPSEISAGFWHGKVFVAWSEFTAPLLLTAEVYALIEQAYKRGLSWMSMIEQLPLETEAEYRTSLERFNVQLVEATTHVHGVVADA